MIFERFEVKGLAHYSYLLGCERHSVAAVVDPKRDVDTYLEFAQARNVRITHVLETHIHADYASGARELADRSGANLLVSRFDRGERFEAHFPHRDLDDNESVELGSIRLTALHTPGHTPEHLSYLVTDAAGPAQAPTALLSGDFLFIGSLGRPDLLGEESKRELANRLFDSVRNRLSPLAGEIAVNPAHGAGSMCGAGMSSRPSSTIANERVANPYLDASLSREAFVERILRSVPPFPPYYRRMKELNSGGARHLDLAAATQPVAPSRFSDLARSGHVVIDVRGPAPFGDGHVPGAFGIGLSPNLAVWASWLVPYDAPLLLVADNTAQALDAARCLARVGLDDFRGVLAGGMAEWTASDLPFEKLDQISPLELSLRLQRGDVRLLDIRGDAERADGHIPGSFHIMGGFVAEHVHELRNDPRPLVVSCAGGYRSTAVASLLQRIGFRNVINAAGGYNAWVQAGLPTT